MSRAELTLSVKGRCISKEPPHNKWIRVVRRDNGAEIRYHRFSASYSCPSSVEDVRSISLLYQVDPVSSLVASFLLDLNLGGGMGEGRFARVRV